MRKIIFALAFGALLLPDYGFTLGLGEIEVTTALNQELNAEIELLSAVPEDVETLIIKLASRDEFIRAGIDRPYLLNSLKFSAELRDGVPFIRVTSDKPIREPFLNFLIEIDWPKGHMLREYTILLDPPVFMEQKAPPAQQDQMRPAAMESSRPAAAGAVPEPQSSSGFRPAVMATTATGPTTMALPVPSPGVQTTQAQAEPYRAVPTYTQTSYQRPDGYRIQQGDTLWSLADSMRPDQSVTIEQMMLAMLRSNPEAFINENVNGLKRGYILRIPDRDDIITLNQAEAVAIVREQNALWREYQQAVTGGEPTSALNLEADDGEGAGLDESGEARLEIVAAGSGISASGMKDPTQMSSSELRSELAIARESLETERVEKEELQQRVDSLEGQVDRMKSLLTLEDDDLAEMQQVATPEEAEAMPVIDVTEEIVVEEQAEVTFEELEIEDDALVEDVTVTEEIVIEEGAVEEVAVEEDAEQIFVDEEQDEEVVEQLAAPAEEFAVEPYTEPASVQQQGPLAALLNNPLLLAAAGGGLLLVLLLIALVMKRRKSGGEEEPAVASNLEDIAEQYEDSDAIREVEVEQVEQELAAVETEAEAETDTIAEELDTDLAAVEPADEDAVVTPPEAAADGEPRDDIIAEADVYLAYGIYQQAEELLQNALKDNPDKDSYRVKLAETYSAGKNSDAFVELATEMNQRRAGKNTPAWQKIVAIGQQIVPDHALFAGASVGDLSMDDLATSSPEPKDIELGSEEDQEAIAPDLGLAFDESEAELVEQTTEESFEPAESVAFDLSEAGAETTIEAEEEGVEFGLDETQAFEAAQTTGDFSLDIEASELGIEDDATTEESTDGEFELDLSAEAEEVLAAGGETEDTGLSLDGVDDASLEIDAAKEQPAAAAPTSMDEDLDLSDLDDVDEVSTKLDLAKAYLDMGDADGTRSILDEVMSEGDDHQKKEAEELLQQLG